MIINSYQIRAVISYLLNVFTKLTVTKQSYFTKLKTYFFSKLSFLVVLIIFSKKLVFFSLVNIFY